MGALGEKICTLWERRKHRKGRNLQYIVICSFIQEHYQLNITELAAGRVMFEDQVN
jgi:hypothetical protein